MEGFIAIGGVTATTEPPEKGVFLRAYWIGLLGFAGTLLLVGTSYFVRVSSMKSRWAWGIISCWTWERSGGWSITPDWSSTSMPTGWARKLGAGDGTTT